MGPSLEQTGEPLDVARSDRVGLLACRNVRRRVRALGHPPVVTSDKGDRKEQTGKAASESLPAPPALASLLPLRGPVLVLPPDPGPTPPPRTCWPQLRWAACLQAPISVHPPDAGVPFETPLEEGSSRWDMVVAASWGRRKCVPRHPPGTQATRLRLGRAHPLAWSRGRPPSHRPAACRLHCPESHLVWRCSGGPSSKCPPRGCAPPGGSSEVRRVCSAPWAAASSADLSALGRATPGAGRGLPHLAAWAHSWRSAGAGVNWVVHGKSGGGDTRTFGR